MNAPSEASGERGTLLAEAESLPGLDVVDSDLDGLPDSLENYGYGTDPLNWDSSGSGVPDGWLARYGFDPLDPTTATRPAVAPAPEDLPEVYAGTWPEAFALTLRDAYDFGRPEGWNESRDGPWGGGLDPSVSDQDGDGIPDGFLWAHGLNPREAGLAAKVLAVGDKLTVREKFEQRLDPTAVDSDADGLDDWRELRETGTNPRAFSTSGSGLPDGWLIHWGLDAKDPSLGFRPAAASGLTYAESYEYSSARFGNRTRTEGAGLDPTRMSTLGLEIPDGWLVRYDLDPLDTGIERRPVANATEFAQSEFYSPLPAGTEAEERRESIRVIEAYRYDRPADWDEAARGPWWGGLDPRTNDTDADGIPDALEIRGFAIIARPMIGPSSFDVTTVTRPDPRLADTDGDGLTDAEEILGRMRRNNTTIVFHPTDPRRQDTDFDALSDLDEVIGPVAADGRIQFAGPYRLNASRADSTSTELDPLGSLLRDGEAFQYWESRSAKYEANGGLAAPYGFPGSRYGTIEAALAKMARPTALSAATAAPGLDMFRPEGDADRDGVPNLLDADADADGLPNGIEIDPTLYGFAPLFESVHAREYVTDPAHADTDGDGLTDRWESFLGKDAFDSESERWFLDPGREISLAETGIPDGEQDYDQDRAEWQAYFADGETLQTQRNIFPFPNLREQTAGTNPFEADTNHDGVPDGYATFWGSEYPRLVSLLQQDILGDHPSIDDDSFRSLVADASPRVSPLVDLSAATLVPDAFDYHRIVEIPDTSFDGAASDEEALLNAAGVLRPFLDERFVPFPGSPPDWVLRDQSVIRGTDLAQLNLARVEGHYEHALPREALLGTNPYTADSDGDGLADSWESAWILVHSSISQGSLRPFESTLLNATRPDASVRLSSGLTNSEIFQVWLSHSQTLDPLAVGGDSDLGGIPDGLEIASLGLDPLDPRDDASILFSGADSDGDGVGDLTEFVNGLDLSSPDTDRDGLLDGQDIRLDPTDPRSARWLALGIAHRPIDTRLEFYGELSRGGDPTDPDTSRYGIPEGWLAYHGYDPTNPRDPDPLALRACYAHGRPDAWNERDHGVWWWGFGPRCSLAVATARDADRDGLDDSKGEDPVPAANRTDLAPDWRVSADPWTGAQTRGECAGNPAPCRSRQLDYDGDGKADSDPAERAPTVLTTIPAAPVISVVKKGDPFVIEATLRRQGSSAGVPNVPVLAALDAPSFARIIGVGVTDSLGRATIDSCVCERGSFTIPVPGITVLGQREGAVGWNLDLSRIEEGTHRIVLFSYNTTVTYFGKNNASDDATHPQYFDFGPSLPAIHAVAGSTHAGFEVVVGSNTTIVRIQAPAPGTPAPRGESINVTLRLQDDHGLPLANRTLTASGVPGLGPSEIPATDATGTVSVALDIPADAPLGNATIRFAFGGKFVRGSEILSPSDLELSVRIVERAFFRHVSIGGSQWFQGDVLRLRGSLDSVLGPAQGFVTVSLASSRVVVALEGGRFQANLSVPETLLGDAEVFMDFAGTESLASAFSSVRIEVLPTHRLSWAPLGHWFRGSEASLAGEVLTPEGNAVEEMEVLVSLAKDGLILPTARTDENGRFSARFFIPDDLRPGNHEVRVALPDNETTAGRTLTRVVPVGYASSFDGLRAEPRATGGFDITGRLLTDDGHALGGQEVLAFTNHAGSPLSATSGNDGEFRIPLPTPPRARDEQTLLVFRGSVDPLVAPTTAPVDADASWIVDVQIQPECVPRDSATLRGSVRIASQDAPSALELRLVHPKGETRVVTDATGQFSLPLELGPSVEPGFHAIRVEILNAPRASPQEVEARFCTSGESRLLWVGMMIAPRGGTLEGRLHLLDEFGEPVPGRAIQLSIGNDAHAAVSSAAGGAPVTIPIPRDYAAGEWRLEADFAGDEFLAGTTLIQPLKVRDASRLVLLSTPSRPHPGDVVQVTLRLEDAQGRPLAGEAVGAVAQDRSAPALYTTNDEGTVTLSLVAGTTPVVFRFAGSESLAPASIGWTPVPSGGSSGWPLGRVVAAIVGAAIVGVTIWVASRKRGAPEIPVAALIGPALGASGIHGNAVLVAFLKFAEIAGSRGLRPSHAESPRAFGLRARDAFRLPAHDMDTLLRLTERVLYGGLGITSRHRRIATEASARLTRALRRIPTSTHGGSE